MHEEERAGVWCECPRCDKEGYVWCPRCGILFKVMLKKTYGDKDGGMGGSGGDGGYEWEKEKREVREWILELRMRGEARRKMGGRRENEDSGGRGGDGHVT